MKACKGLLLVCFLGLSVSSCFNPPEFSNTPEISIQKVQFKETPEVSSFDTLVLYLDFTDGNGDLGLDPEDPRYFEEPFNDSYFFIADGVINGSGVGGLKKVTYTTVYTVDGTASYDLLNIPFDVTGKLVTDKTRDDAGYGGLPVFNPNSCLNYSQSELLVAEADGVVDASYNIIDTLYNGTSRYFLIDEPFYYERNANHYNIEVRFLKYVGNSCVGSDCPFEEYDWFENQCIDFNGRFPYITNSPGSPVAGTIRYAMTNPSFIGIFGNTPLKLAVKIRDRALNTSDEVQTPQFLLRR